MAYRTRKCASRRRKASRHKTYRRKAHRGGKRVGAEGMSSDRCHQHGGGRGEDFAEMRRQMMDEAR